VAFLAFHTNQTGHPDKTKYPPIPPISATKIIYFLRSQLLVAGPISRGQMNLTAQGIGKHDQFAISFSPTQPDLFF